MGYNYYGYQSPLAEAGNIFAVIVLLSLAGAVLVNFLFLSKKNEGKYEGFVGWLYDVLSFKKLMAEHLMRILCMFFMFLILGFGIAFMFHMNPLVVLLVMVLLIVIVRLGYEFAMLNIIICRNTSEINQKLGEKHTEHTESHKKPGKICPFCKRTLAPTDHFCPYCGHDLE